MSAAVVPLDKFTRRLLTREEALKQIRDCRLPEPQTEFLFARELKRKWRFDLCWPQFHVALEVESLVVKKLAGMIIVMGRHSTVQSFRDDTVKQATAVELGWAVLHFEDAYIRDGTAVEHLKRVLVRRGWDAR